MDNFGYIYTFWDKKLKRYVYVGQTNDFKSRMKKHLWESKQKNPYSSIEIEIMEYGINNYDITKMEFPISELNNKERYFIRYFQTREYYGGCNLTDGGDGVRGYKWTEEDKNKLSKPKKGQSLGDLNPELSKQWHPTKNGDLTPFNVCPNSGKKVWWICKKRHEWESTVDNRNRQSGCPYCSGNKVCADNCLATLNPELSKEWSLTKNGVLVPCNVTPGSHKKVWWACKKCNFEWESIVSDRNRGVGCPNCANKNKKEDMSCVSKSYKIISPKNEIFIIKGTLKQFCRKYNLSYTMMRDYLYKKYKKDNYKGWKIEYSTNEEYLKYKENNNVWFS